MPLIDINALKNLRVNEMQNINQFSKVGYTEEIQPVFFEDVKYEGPQEIVLDNLKYGSENSYIEIDPNVFFTQQFTDMVVEGVVN